MQQKLTQVLMLQTLAGVILQFLDVLLFRRIIIVNEKPPSGSVDKVCIVMYCIVFYCIVLLIDWLVGWWLIDWTIDAIFNVRC